MKYSYKWLKELSGISSSPEEVAELLMLHAFEVNGIDNPSEGLDGVVVGEVLEVEKHPDADKLKLVKVDIGSEILNIVCGASNIEKRQKVPVARVGAKLPNGLEIREVEIRGKKSSGMVCAEDELDLGDSHEGIMVMNNSLEKGLPIKDALDLDDSIIDIDVLANRGHDALSHVGMAREIVALSGSRLNYDYDGLSLNQRKEEPIEVSIGSAEMCSRYIGAVMEGVEVKESPQWLRNRLEKSGIRPINNIVDTTNYVMLELGQPMHAFDFEEVGKKIYVRNSKKGEELELLDGTKKKLSENDVIIADSQKTLALAGIMGGVDSSVRNKTTKIILEAANFNPSSVRRTRMRLGIMTDSALRFEKELDPNLAEKAMSRAIEILEDIAGAKLRGIKDVYPRKNESWDISLEFENISNLLGEEIEKEECISILESLGAKVNSNESNLQVKIPTFRLDLKTQEDLIEEIGRVYGYENIKPQPFFTTVKTPKDNKSEKAIRKIRSLLACDGFIEVYNYSFYGQKEKEQMKLDSINHLEIENPISQNLKYLRSSLAPEIIKNISENLKNYTEMKIFEVGNVYFKEKDSVVEKTMISGAVVEVSSKSKGKDKREESIFYEAKSFLESLLREFSIENLSYEKNVKDDKLFWHYQRAAEVLCAEVAIGKVGEVHPMILEEFDIKARVAFFELDLGNIIKKRGSEKSYEPLNKFPSIVRDISLLVDSSLDVTVGSLIEKIYEKGGGLVTNVELFDSIAYSEKENSFAFHITFASKEKTLESEEVEKLIQNIISSLERSFSVKIRK